MKISAFLVLLAFSMICANPVSADQRDAKQPKGAELYSWTNSRGEWQFALLPGTNRAKSRDEVRHLKYRSEGIAAVKKRLAQLADGEAVCWITGIFDSTSPDQTIVNDIISASANAGVGITVMHGTDQNTKGLLFDVRK